MILRILFVVAVLTSSCKTKTPDWHTLDFGDFKLKAPKEWNKFKKTGIDAYVGGLTNGTDSLWFYYGQYISGPTGNESDKCLFGQDTINGFTSVIVIPKKDSVGKIELFIPRVAESSSFELNGYGIKDVETVLKIFKSLTFENSDTTRNSVLNYIKFREYPFGSGRTLFYQYCMSCHPVNKIVDGSTIQYLIRGRSTEWIYKFLTNRNQVAADSLLKARLKEYNLNCMKFDNLSMRDVEQIVEYIKSQ